MGGFKVVKTFNVRFLSVVSSYNVKKLIFFS